LPAVPGGNAAARALVGRGGKYLGNPLQFRQVTEK
jgi:hypothetical protein